MKLAPLALAALTTFAGFGAINPAPAEAAVPQTYTVTYRCKKYVQGAIPALQWRNCVKNMNRQQYDAYLFRTFTVHQRLVFDRATQTYVVWDKDDNRNPGPLGGRLVSKNLWNMEPGELEAIFQVLVVKFHDLRRTEGLFDDEIEARIYQDLYDAGWPKILAIGLAKETKVRIQTRGFDAAAHERPGDNDLVAARVPALNAASLAEFNAFNRSVERQWAWHNLVNLVEGGHVGTPAWDASVRRWVLAVQAG